MKFLKILFFTLLTLVILVIGGAYVAMQLIDMEQIKEMVQQRVEQETGRKLIIAGDVEPTIGFVPTVTIHTVSLTNPSWAKAPQMATVDKLRVAMELMPLLDGDIRVTDIQLDGAKIYLEKNKGQSSWQFERPDQGKPSDSAMAEADSKNSSASSLQIRQVTVTKSEVQYSDHSSGATHQMAIDRLEIEDLSEHGVGHLLLKGAYNNASLEVSGSLSEDNLMLIDAMLKKGASSLLAKGSVSLEDMTFDLAMEMKAARLSEALAIAGVPSDNEAGLIMKAALGGKPEMVSFSNMSMRYDDTEINGSGHMNLAGDVPYIQADLKIPLLKHESEDAPLEETAQAGENTGTPQAGAPIPDMPIPTDGLHAVNADIKLQISEMQTRKLTLKDIQTTIKLDDAVLTIMPFEMATSQGWVKGTMTVDAADATPVLNAEILTNDIVLGALLHEMAGQTAIEGGIVTSELTVKAAGNTLHTMLDSADGTVNFFVDDAVYHVPATAQKAEAFINLLRGSDDKPNEIKLACGVGRFTLTKGVANTELLALKTGNAVVVGEGTIRLKDTMTDMVLTAKSGLAGLAGAVPPVCLKGPIAWPAIIPDAEGTVAALQKMVRGDMSAEENRTGGLDEQAIGTMEIMDNPCVQGMIETLQAAPETPKEQYEQIEDAVREKRDNVKEDLRQLKDDTKELREGLKGLFKKQ